jgi:hypothetical protein
VSDWPTRHRPDPDDRERDRAARWLTRVEEKLDHTIRLLHDLQRRTALMSADLNALDQAISDLGAELSTGLDALEAKLAEAAPTVDVSAEIAALKAVGDNFAARVATDTAPPAPPAEPAA